MDQPKRKLSVDELREFFESQQIPKLMANEYMVFRDVQFTLDLHFGYIKSEIERVGFENIKRSTIAVTSKERLTQMKEILENKNTYFEW